MMHVLGPLLGRKVTVRLWREDRESERSDCALTAENGRCCQNQNQDAERVLDITERAKGHSLSLF